MTNDESRDDGILTNLADALKDFPHLHQKLPRPTDRDILRAMLGKPFASSDEETVTLRKAG